MTTVSSATKVGTWIIDASHSEVSFAVRHLMIATVRGSFHEIEGLASFDPQGLEAGKVEVQIAAASIDTRNSDRDAHLRSAEFFDAERFPRLTFTSQKVRHLRENRYAIDGDLTIRDVTRAVTFEAEFSEVVPDPFGYTRMAVSASTNIIRTDFGLNWNQALETGGVLVGEEVKITIEAQLVQS